MTRAVHKLTIVIPCCDDSRVVDCVASIDADADVDVVIAFNGSPAGFVDEITRRTAKRCGVRVRSVDVPPANLSAALEKGIGAITSSRVLLMDSDCTFRPGAIDAISAAMDAGDPANQVFKGGVVFGRHRGPFASVIAHARQHYTVDALTAFKPPLAFDTCLRERLGGYFFDERLPWKEDADLDCRVRSAGIEIVAVPDCVIDHDALTVREDLRSNYRYGVGAAIAEHLDIAVTHPNRSPRDASRRYGKGAAAYLWVANQAKRVGHHVTRRRLARESHDH